MVKLIQQSAMDTQKELSTFLGRNNVGRIPLDIFRKVEMFCEKNNRKFTEEKASHNDTKRNIGKYAVTLTITKLEKLQ